MKKYNKTEELSCIEELIMAFLCEKEIELIDGEVLPPEWWNGKLSMHFIQPDKVEIRNCKDGYGEIYKAPQSLIEKYASEYELAEAEDLIQYEKEE